jgi:aspartyl-tRNA(Asn)/glutamyl-tRNA(Gln) amidotransferase subunit B
MAAISQSLVAYTLIESDTFPAASEVYRHIELLDRGVSVPQETRGFDEDRMVTYKLRSKEDTPDYRYMPDSNLPPILLSEVRV